VLVAHDARAMGAAIAGLLHDPHRARHLGANARRMVETTWSLDAATDRIEYFLTRYARAAVP